jgi:hypothetical protein
VQAGSVGHPLVLSVTPTPAGSLTPTGSVTGPYRSPFPRSGPTTSQAASPASGPGLLRLAMEAPGTSWGPGPPSSTVVDATLTDTTTGQTVGTQQFVLFWGASPFVYAGFTGQVTTTDRYRVTITVEPSAASNGLSQPAPGAQPNVRLVDRALEVVTPSNPQYLAYAYAPVMYGRSTSALQDVPLLAYAAAVPAGGNATTLSYVVVWSHEDSGTGFLPFLEWGEWGRITDVETAISFTVQPDGSVTGAQYLSGGEPPTGFPDSQTALSESDKPFTGQWSGHHPILRDATGNNDFSAAGTTRFRFDLAPVGPPAPGQTREAVMDANPFTYQVMAEEVPRWYSDVQTDPDSPQPGQAEQYAIVALDTAGSGASSVAVGLQLSGSTRWYLSDLGWEYPLVTSGDVRTVVKLPVGWSADAITGVRVEVVPPTAATSVTVTSLRVERFDGRADSVTTVRTPAPVVVPEVLQVAPALALRAEGSLEPEASPGSTFAGMDVVVRDQAQAPLAGAAVTFSIDDPPAGVQFANCGCTTEKATSVGDGLASSGPMSTSGDPGTVQITATSADPSVAAVAMAVRIG